MNERALVSHPSLSFEGSQIMLRAAESKATEIGVPMCIAIVDAGGHLLAFSPRVLSRRRTFLVVWRRADVDVVCHTYTFTFLP